MSNAGRSALTLTVLVGVVVIWLVWGLSEATRPFPGQSATPTCTDNTVPQGSRVTPDQVTVSVLNAGTREGLAGRTMQLFLDGGFAEGDGDNAPAGTEVSLAQIWTDDPESPAVRLVASRIEGVEVVQMDSPAAGITVVVGDEFQELVDGRARVRAQQDAEVCGPAA